MADVACLAGALVRAVKVRAKSVSRAGFHNGALYEAKKQLVRQRSGREYEKPTCTIFATVRLMTASHRTCALKRLRIGNENRVRTGNENRLLIDNLRIDDDDRNLNIDNRDNTTKYSPH